MKLNQQKCVPCSGGEAPLPESEVSIYHEQVPDWQVIDDAGIMKIKRTFVMKNFIEAVGLVNQIAEIAEAEQHHPNLSLHDYKKLTVELYTHKTMGLHVNDFILASKIDQLQ